MLLILKQSLLALMQQSTSGRLKHARAVEQEQNALIRWHESEPIYLQILLASDISFS